MNKFLFCAATACCLLACKSNSPKQNLTSGLPTCDTLSKAAADSVKAEVDPTPLGAKVILETFPDYIKEFKDNRLIFADGRTVEYDDGREKSFVEMLDNCDVEDMFHDPYVKDSIPSYLSDIGRGRSEKLYKALYGSSQKEAGSHLVAVNWFGQRIMFTSVNGANKQLEKVAGELAGHPEYKKYLTNASTYYWRQVRGANRLSAHSYGIAVDINTSFSDYWLWAFGKVSENQKIGYKNRIPLGIVEIFEKYGFIWGGRWYHFDTMHFEYRPELIRYAEIKSRN